MYVVFPIILFSTVGIFLVLGFVFLFFVFLLLLQNNSLPKANTIMNHKSNIAIVVEVANKILHHKAITIRYIDTSVQQSQQLVFKNNQTHAICKNDIDIAREATPHDIPGIYKVLHDTFYESQFIKSDKEKEEYEGKFNDEHEIRDKVISDIESTLNSNANENEMSKIIQISQPNMQDVVDACKREADNTDLEIDSTKRTHYIRGDKDDCKLFILIVLKMKLLLTVVICIYMILNALR